jgi:glycosyltransferase involved in cell wall biosynthesis
LSGPTSRVSPSPAVSVLLPVHNGMPYICEAIDSIVAQTFEDWELIVIDNASNDGSFEYLQ